jgi:two-component system nitrate/nitrite response regulator NarL
MNQPIRIALVDDHQIVIDGLTALLKGQDHIHVAFATTRPEAVLSHLHQTPVDLLITDIQMPGFPGNTLAKQVREQFPEIRIMVLSMLNEWAIIDEMINEVDISGYILKNISKKELLTAIEKIAANGIYFSEEVLQALRQTPRTSPKEEIHLTARELEIIRLIEKEYSNKLISETLFISERTVETHRKNIFRKTKTNSVLGIVKYAYEHKLI